MSEPLYTSHVTLEKLGSLDRRAHLPLGVEVDMGVYYRLRISAGAREVVDRALAKHKAKCPTAASLEGAVKLSWTAEIEEA